MKMGELTKFCNDFATDWERGVVSYKDLVDRIRTSGVRWYEIRIVLKLNHLWVSSMDVLNLEFFME